MKLNRSYLWVMFWLVAPSSLVFADEKALRKELESLRQALEKVREEVRNLKRDKEPLPAQLSPAERQGLLIASLRRDGCQVLIRKDKSGRPIIDIHGPPMVPSPPKTPRQAVVRPRDVDRMLARMKHLRHVRSITLFGRAGDAGLVHLVDMKSLRKLTLNSNTYTDIGLLFVRRLSNLTHLSLGEPLPIPTQRMEVTATGLRYLRSLKKLRTLQVHGIRFDEACLQQLAAMTQLRELVLDKCSFPGQGILALRNLQLRKLTVDWPIMRSGRHLKLSGLISLKELTLSGISIRPESVVALGPMSKLQSLDLQGSSINGRSLAAIADKSQLRELLLHHTSIGGTELKHLKRLANLERLELGDGEVTNDHLRHLRGLRKLRVFSANRIQLTDGGLAPLSSLAELRALRLHDGTVTRFAGDLPFHLQATVTAGSSTKTTTGKRQSGKKSLLTDKSLAHLTPLTRLEYLGVSGSFTIQGVKTLNKLPHLKLVAMPGVDLGRESHERASQFDPTKTTVVYTERYARSDLLDKAVVWRHISTYDRAVNSIEFPNIALKHFRFFKDRMTFHDLQFKVYHITESTKAKKR